MLQPAATVAPESGGPLAVVGTLVLAWAFFGFTAQAAATYLLGDAPWRRAAVVGVVPAVVTMALIRYDPPVILAVAVAADYAALSAVYRLSRRRATLLTLGHVVASVALAVPLANLVTLLGSAPA